MKKHRIVICPGHYPKDRCQARYFGLVENAEAMKVVDRLIPILSKKYDISTFNGTLKSDVKNIKEVGVDFALDLHFNACKSHRVQGTECLIWADGHNKGDAVVELSDSICDSISTSLNIPNRGTKEGYVRGNPSRGRYYFLRKLYPMGIIVEILFMDNKKDVKFLLENEHLKIASAIALGIQRSLITEPDIDIRIPDDMTEE